MLQQLRTISETSPDLQILQKQRETLAAQRELLQIKPPNPVEQLTKQILMYTQPRIQQETDDDEFAVLKRYKQKSSLIKQQILQREEKIKENKKLVEQ